MVESAETARLHSQPTLLSINLPPRCSVSPKCKHHPTFLDGHEKMLRTRLC